MYKIGPHYCLKLDKKMQGSMFKKRVCKRNVYNGFDVSYNVLIHKGIQRTS